MKKLLWFLVLPGIVTAVFLLTLWGQITAAASQEGSAAPNVSVVDAFPNLTFDQPVDIAHAGDERLFIVEQSGRIRVTPLDPNSTAAPLFLDMTSPPDWVESGPNEAGLLGLVFHPNYAGNGYFYVNYTHRYPDEQLVTRISRFSVTADPHTADPASELIILEVEQPFNNHNAGDLSFGPDGYLYFGLGDGGDGGDPDERAQNINELLGKMIRIDVDKTDPGLNYAVPTDNPLVGQPGRDEIWAIGLRNPWRFSFDRQTGDMYIGDVGQGSWEEIDFEAAGSDGGLNYGWDVKEGSHCYPPSVPSCDDTGMTDPIYEYPTHVSGTCAVTGGFVYRGLKYPLLRGYYLFADYCAGDLWGLLPDGNGRWTFTPLATIGSLVTTFGQDLHGEVYAARRGAGKIYQIQENTPPGDERVYLPLIQKPH